MKRHVIASLFIALFFCSHAVHAQKVLALKLKDGVDVKTCEKKTIVDLLKSSTLEVLDKVPGLEKSSFITSKRSLKIFSAIYGGELVLGGLLGGEGLGYAADVDVIIVYAQRDGKAQVAIAVLKQPGTLRLVAYDGRSVTSKRMEGAFDKYVRVDTKWMDYAAKIKHVAEKERAVVKTTATKCTIIKRGCGFLDPLHIESKDAALLKAVANKLHAMGVKTTSGKSQYCLYLDKDKTLGAFVVTAAFASPKGRKKGSIIHHVECDAKEKPLERSIERMIYRILMAMGYFDENYRIEIK